MKIYDLYEMSGRNLWRRKLRSGLTILGVIIGTASIVMMFSLSEAMNVNYENQMNQWGELSLIEVTEQDDMDGLVDITVLDAEALTSLEALEQVEKVMPAMQTSATLTIGQYGTMQEMTIVGYDADELEILGYEVAEGRLYEAGEENVVIAGGNIENYLIKKGENLEKKNLSSSGQSSQTSGRSKQGGMSSMRPSSGMSAGMMPSGMQGGEIPSIEEMMTRMKEREGMTNDTSGPDLYNDRAMITFETFDFRKTLMREVGQSQGAMGDTTATTTAKPVTVEIVGKLESGNSETDNKIFVPRATLTYLMTQKELQDAKSEGRTPDMDLVSSYDKVLVKVENSEQVESVRAQIEWLGFETNGAQDTLDEMKQMSSNIQVILLAIGAISLIVAAIGITNTMMTSIYERTKEIGVMKVIGATITDIKKIFLVEAAIIGFLGGVFGISLCYVIAYLLNTYGREFFSSLVATSGAYETYVAVITPSLGIGSVLFSTIIGIVSGYMPAKRATSLSALTAIRND